MNTYSIFFTDFAYEITVKCEISNYIGSCMSHLFSTAQPSDDY